MGSLHSWNLKKAAKNLLQLQGQRLLQERGIKVKGYPILGFYACVRYLSSGEVFTALKPFFFAVHPDLFGQHPEKGYAVNENSLKQLNEYIESASHDRGVRPTRLTFYLRNGNGAGAGPDPPAPPKPVENVGKFQSVRIDLGQRNVRETVYTILEKCNLPTSYVDSLPKSPPPKQPRPNPFSGPGADHWRPPNAKGAETDIKQKKAARDDLGSFLDKNVEPARKKLHECWPIREEIIRLRKDICDQLGVSDIVWDAGAPVTFESFQAMASQHPHHMEGLKGRTVVFGRDTGVSLDGHVILFSGEVRSNWLDLIKRVHLHDSLILRIPNVESALSGALKDIKVVHRKFQPTRLAETYEVHLRKIITSIGDYRGKNCFPAEWPANLSHLELVVETEAGPLMISPTGQIIVPSSCPAFLLVNFITNHMEEASQKLEQYKTQKYTEIDLHEKCVKVFNLVALQKDDNVTPHLMIECCTNLLARSSELSTLLKGTHLWITTYYSVLSDGEICIPWNWK
ncbi:T-cell activation inhibitor, mitochondrial [Orchesella cincta]|uniref:T-cell activation inhibitor, mitochondrial n=1 Tax=Orchesella cincta TaxID=48709 RepID=A0A1D2NAU9_ORCCI|nr:T-cell activation inhibitor, mitochondrial [Orchesella cincta]